MCGRTHRMGHNTVDKFIQLLHYSSLLLVLMWNDDEVMRVLAV